MHPYCVVMWVLEDVGGVNMLQEDAPQVRMATMEGLSESGGLSYLVYCAMFLSFVLLQIAYVAL